ncbi:NADH-quinone oxidoreductase subunit NuoK [Heliophilum fasciatum]|uniref:NADH-quinone oxidoreductase subunit K n=1 Tax=Heliophilum fasciatum TaxID=35700 RepID=A0A4R2RNA5_9FIRM|nr:NADH-quinone oxidoreductase subunit NuoK [Heliophilum fasciatum]MCW2277962.1 NADH-quinone oxidoreductase subunit K [Heliophilum fasciatum]TCP64468.1 NADH dehydrogenase subunit K [Heliophilum fasciatum]
MTVGLTHFLILGTILFSLGLYTVFAKRSAIAILMGIELMLNAVNVNLIAFNRYVAPESHIGQIFSVFVIVVAAAEVAVGLALVISIYRDRISTNVDDLDWLKW